MLGLENGETRRDSLDLFAGHVHAVVLQVGRLVNRKAQPVEELIQLLDYSLPRDLVRKTGLQQLDPRHGFVSEPNIWGRS
jgi:hypothetical protein